MNAPKAMLVAVVLASVMGADTPVPYYPAAPVHGEAPLPGQVVEQSGGCASCSRGTPHGGCKTCGKGLIIGHKPKPPYNVTLCPGACFGYFQTQWRKWDEACPYPYIGAGVTDVPKPPAPYLPSGYDKLPADKKPAAGGGLSAPRPFKSDDPVTPPGGTTIPGGTGGLPPIPNP